ncbi:MAG: alpha/beta fold hydrolase [Gemmataceae bacterium]
MSSANSSKMYLLSGNGSTAGWWRDALPHFQRLEPIPLELPGFGDNPDTRFHSLDELAEALIEMTKPGHQIFVVGVNGLVVLHALVRAPRHFDRVILLAPVGAFLWERNFVKVMKLKPFRKLIHWILRTNPKFFRRKFTQQQWPDETYERLAEGYRKCRAFQPYFDIVQAHSALNLFEWITTPVDLVWGTKDGVLGVEQAAAWDSILPRAPLTITIREDWGHYPYLDDPAAFVHDLESFQGEFPAHTKAGRLKLAKLAGLPVPKQTFVANVDELESALADFSQDQVYAVRSSGVGEDHIEHSHAGQNETFLRVPSADIHEKVRLLLEEHELASAVVQQFIEPRVSGVAFCRWMSLEIEYVSGHLEEYISGKATPHRAILSKMPGDWTLGPQPLPQEPTFSFTELGKFLRRCLKAFHYHPSDIEWAWDGRDFYLLQLRPITQYDWRRCLTSANLDELLPPRVSRVMEQGQRHASLSISRIYALWDPCVLNDHEPFTTTSNDASYINADLFLSRMFDWGLPSSLLAKEIGGAVPRFSFNFFRFVRSLPILLKMQRVVRREIQKVEQGLLQFEQELTQLEQREWTSSALRDEALVNWFVRYYAFIVRSNMIINACLTTSGGNFLGRPRTVYRDMEGGKSLNRLEIESDPATPREKGEAPPLQPFPKWGFWTRLGNWLGVPGLGGRYFEVREWFRDNNMRLFFRLHHALQGSEWLQPISGTRDRSGTFWQSGGETLQQDFSFVIYPGKVTGTVGEDILIVDALEPGHYERYKEAKAVVARTGGRLSHGATLLRELRKPSAVLQELPAGLEVGREAVYDNGRLTGK